MTASLDSCRPAVPARSAASIEGPAAPAPLDIDRLPDRDLDQAELVRVAATLAREPQVWRQHVDFAAGERHFVSLHRDAHVDIWLICWSPQNDTGWHDHDISSGSVAVVDGCLVERNLAVGGANLATEVTSGLAFSFGPDHIHRLVGRDAGTVSIHAYSPPLWRMGQYQVDANGLLRRTSVSYAEELRPWEVA
jgi:hypothetical protein